MKSLLIATAAAALAVTAGAALAQTAGRTAPQLTINTVQAPNAAALTVTSPAFTNGGAIPLENSAYGDNKMPGLSWSAGPAGTQSYLVVFEDPDAGGAQPFLHWIAGNIPASVTALAPGLTAVPEGAFQTGVRGNQYFGPRPPSGLHNYTFQVFALDRRLEAADGARLGDIKTQIAGHILASGVLVGTYAGPAAAN